MVGQIISRRYVCYVLAKALKNKWQFCLECQPPSEKRFYVQRTEKLRWAFIQNTRGASGIEGKDHWHPKYLFHLFMDTLSSRVWYHRITYNVRKVAGLHLWVGRLILIPGGHILLASSGCSTGECAKTPLHCLSENTLRIMLSRKLLKKWSWSSFSFINGVKTHYSILFEWNNYTLGLKEEADGEDRGGGRKLGGEGQEEEMTAGIGPL